MMSRFLSENKKRQLSGALLGNAPMEIHFELYNIKNPNHIRSKTVSCSEWPTIQEVAV